MKRFSPLSSLTRPLSIAICLCACGSTPTRGADDGGGATADGGAIGTDAGAADGGATGADGGAADGGLSIDGGTSDGGPPPDGGGADGGSVDAGIGDGGARDGGLVDGGLVDGGLVVVPICSGAGTVTGVSLDTHHPTRGDGGTVAVPVDLSMTAIGALAETPDGGFCEARGTGNTTGMFTVPNAPASPYLLRLGRSYTRTDSYDVDTGIHRLGRANPVLLDSPTSQATLSITVSNLKPWTDGDELQIFIPNNASWIPNVEFLNPNGDAIAPNTTTLTAFQIDPSFYAYEVEPSQGDQALLTQLAVKTTTDGILYRAVQRFTTLSAFVLRNGGTAQTTGILADVPQSRSVSLTWRRSQFAALAPAVHPQATAGGDYVYVSAFPPGLEDGLFDVSSDLLIVDVAPETNTDPAGSQLSYGNPFPASWALYAFHGRSYGVTYSVPGASARQEFGSVNRTFGVDALSSEPVEPVLSPPRNPRINNLDAFVERSGVGRTPTLTWSTPAIGTPTHYLVRLRRLFRREGATRTQAETVTTFRTRDTRLVIPPNVLLPDESYYAQIHARIDTGVDIHLRPFAQGFPAAIATAFTARFTP